MTILKMWGIKHGKVENPPNQIILRSDHSRIETYGFGDPPF